MYNNIPKSCEFGGCKLFEECNEDHKLKLHGRNYMSPPLDLTKCAEPCAKCEECFTYDDKYNNNLEVWTDMHGIDEEDEDE